MIPLVGAAVGLTLSALGTRLLASLLFEIRPADPLSLGATCAVLVGAATAAAYLPARRATRVDPADALRSE